VSARSALRDGTRVEHERVDRLFGGLDLTAPLDYRLFLTAQATAFLPVETALEQAGVATVVADWPERRRSQLLRDDLAALEAPLPAPETAPELVGAPAILGAVYVVEGSRLGGAMLRRGLADSVPQSFLRHPQGSGAWRKLLETLDHSLYETAALETALRAARSVFGCFEAGGRRVLEYRAK
jgi:heme oxygenase